MPVARALIGVVLALAAAGCFVPDVTLGGKSCDRGHSCDVGYACVDVGDGGIGTCLLEDAGH